MNFSEYEHKIVNDAIQPGGARLKQSDAVLNDICKAAESLGTNIVGSLLIFKLRSDTLWISKAVKR